MVGGRPGVVDDLRRRRAAGVREDRLAEPGIAGGDRRGHRHAPALRLSQGAALHHGRHVEPDVLGHIRDGRAQGVERFHPRPPAASARPPSSCTGTARRSEGRRGRAATSSTLRPTERSFTRGEADDALRVDDERGAQRHALLLVQDAERGRELALGVGQHGNGRVLRSAWSRRHARWTKCVSVLMPSTWASRSSNSELRLPNSAISVGQTKVKSMGQEKSTTHLPGWLRLVRRVNSRPLSVLTTASRSNSGRRSPTVSIWSPCSRPGAAARVCVCAVTPYEGARPCLVS